VLKEGREKSLLRRHPWIFSGAVARLEGQPSSGDTLRVVTEDGQFVAWAAYSPQSNILARAWSFDPHEVVDAAFLRRRLQRAIELRQFLLQSGQSDSVRLVHGESDGLPGLVVDLFGGAASGPGFSTAGGTMVGQFLSAGAERWREVLADQLMELTGAVRFYERSDADVRRLEGLPERSGPLRGDAPPRLTIQENGLWFTVDAAGGHKTGYYLDQRDNRLRLRHLAAGREVLDCFSYVGGFLLNAVQGGAASALAVDSSADALAAGREHLAMNNLPAGNVDWLEGDVFQVLRRFRDQNRKFDLIVLDPPKFAPTAAQAQQAARGYKDINLLAFKLLRPGGLLFTFSCSGGVDADLFGKIVTGAALDAGVDARILYRMFQSSDHPVALNFPEGAYLKGLVLEV
jgi:23S rRNA (cytosine1962-C5)-methyltransferase